MTLYLFCFLLGFFGFLATALVGLSHSHSPGKHVHHPAAGRGARAPGRAISKTVLRKSHAAGGGQLIGSLLGFPRLVFSLCLGFGSTGLLLHDFVSEMLRVLLAGGGAIVFHRFAVAPITSFFMHFASTPARTLEDALLEEARAVTDFNPRGEGLVLVRLDGRAIQLLARLEKSEHTLGLRIRSGDRVTISAINPKNNSCRVLPQLPREGKPFI